MTINMADIEAAVLGIANSLMLHVATTEAGQVYLEGSSASVCRVDSETGTTFTVIGAGGAEYPGLDFRNARNRVATILMMDLRNAARERD